jgi:hypothetical protein
MSLHDLPNGTHPVASPARLLQLVPGTGRKLHAQSTGSAVRGLVAIAVHRCSGFCAQAAVLVLVFGLLDFFILKGRMEIGWLMRTLAASLTLLAGSVVLDFCAQRWMKTHK